MTPESSWRSSVIARCEIERSISFDEFTSTWSPVHSDSISTGPATQISTLPCQDWSTASWILTSTFLYRASPLWVLQRKKERELFDKKLILAMSECLVYFCHVQAWVKMCPVRPCAEDSYKICLRSLKFCWKCRHILGSRNVTSKRCFHFFSLSPN